MEERGVIGIVIRDGSALVNDWTGELEQQVMQAITFLAIPSQS